MSSEYRSPVADGPEGGGSGAAKVGFVELETAWKVKDRMD